MKKSTKQLSILMILAIFLYLFLTRYAYNGPKEPAFILSVTKDKFSIIRSAHEIYAVSPDGSGQTNFPLATKLEEPQWSPDRCWIIFSTGFSETSHAGGNSEIYLMPHTGEYIIQVTNNPLNDYAPSWSTDGKRIIYHNSASTAEDTGIYLMDLTCLLEGEDCQPQPQFIVKGLIPEFSPVSNEILVTRRYTEKSSLFIYNLETKKQYDLGISNGQDAVWSPDGKKIAYADRNLNTVVVMDRDGSNKITPVSGEAYTFNPSWSPDGKHLLFLSYRDDYGKQFTYSGAWGPVITSGLFSLELSTGKITQLSAYTNELTKWYAWYPGPPESSCE